MKPAARGDHPHFVNIRSTLSLVVVAFVLFSATLAHAVPMTFNNQPSWFAAAGGSAAVTVFHFDGPTETNGKSAVDPTIIPSYSSQGVDFLPFMGTSIFPEIFRGQAFQIADPLRDGLLGNLPSPNPTSDLDGRAIKFNFNTDARSVGVHSNIGDGGFIAAFDSSMNLIAQANIASGGFGGIVSDQLIAHVAIVNTFDGDIKFGIWDLQFSAQPESAAPIPEPSTMLLLGTGLVGLISYGWRRKKQAS